MNTLSGSELVKEDTFRGDGSAMGAKDDDHPIIFSSLQPDSHPSLHRHFHTQRKIGYVDR